MTFFWYLTLKKFFLSHAQNELLKTLLFNPDLMTAEDREKLIKNLVANMDNLDPEAQKALLKQLLENPNLLPPEEREKMIKDLLANISSLDPYVCIYFQILKIT
jgi:hypothetical protein